MIMVAHNECSHWHRKPVYRIDDNGVKHWYPSLAEAGRQNYIADSCICVALKKHIKSSGYFWEYADDEAVI